MCLKDKAENFPQFFIIIFPDWAFDQRYNNEKSHHNDGDEITLNGFSPNFSNRFRSVSKSILYHEDFSTFLCHKFNMSFNIKDFRTIGLREKKIDKYFSMINE